MEKTVVETWQILQKRMWMREDEAGKHEEEMQEEEREQERVGLEEEDI